MKSRLVFISLNPSNLSSVCGFAVNAFELA